MNKTFTNIFSILCLSFFCFFQSSAQCTDNDVTITVGGGAWDSEIGWSLVDGSGTVVASGGAPYSGAACLLDDCYTMNMTDSWGDGWNGATYTITDNNAGTVYGTGTLASGSIGSDLVSIGAACTGAGPCASIISLSCGVTTNYSLASGTGSWNPPGPWGTPGNEQVFSFTAISSGVHTIVITHNSSWYVDLFESNICSSSGWGYVGDIGSSATFTGTLTAGMTYYFLIDDEDNTFSLGTINISCPSSPPPPNPSSFCDDFEAYNVNNPIAETSTNWHTWDELMNGSVAPFIDDANVNNIQSNSGFNSIGFIGQIGGGPSDVILPFGTGTPYTSGYFEFSANFYVESSGTGAYFNFQEENSPGINWALDVGMSNGTINFGTYLGSWSVVYLSSSYPSNQWFELKIYIDLNSNSWSVYIDGALQGSFVKPNTQIASLDLYPLEGNQFYVDDVCYEYSTIPIDTFGCTDPTATNYNPNATIDDGSCIYDPCGPDSIEIVITITTDDYPTETSWFLMDQFGGGWTNVPISSSFNNTLLTWTLCVPDTNCYTFTMLDSYGDGICCTWGQGSYSISYDGIIVGSGGSFAFEQEHCSIGVCTPNCQIVIPPNAISENEPCGTDVNHGCDDNWRISNFTITGVEDPWSWGYYEIFGSCPPINPDCDPELFIVMTKNSNFYYYSDWYTYSPSPPVSFSMYANQPTSTPLVVPQPGLFNSPYVLQTNTYEFSIGDNDGGTIQNLGWNNNDYIGSYTLPTLLTAGVNSITTSGGPDGNAYVDYTAVAPTTIYTPLTNNSTIHATFWAENANRDTDWYSFSLSDSSTFTVNAISETPFNVMLLDATNGCGGTIVIDSAFALGCDTINIQQSLPAGDYWILTFPATYSCMSCFDSTDYLLAIDWTDNCNLDVTALATEADCSGDNAQINLTINGGTSPFNYSWNSGDSTQDLQNISIGIYDVLVTDNKGCTDTVSNIVVNPGVLIHDFYATNYVMDFEPIQDFSGWLIDDANNDGYSWNVNQYTGVNSSYGAIYNYNTNGITPADDWLFSQCFVLDSAENYYLSFLSRVASPAFPEDMSVFIGSTQESTFMSAPLMQINNMTNVIYDSLGTLFTVPTSGIYYFGWHAQSSANSWRIDLDNINLGLFVQQFGCTDSLAMNYNSQATIDDSSCIYPFYGCIDSTAFNYNPLANIDNGSCIAMVYGCTDSTAINYYAGATSDDGSCIYNLFGCTDPLAINYNPTVLIDDGSCIYAFYGCTDSTAVNYNSLANIEDSSCVYCIDGCTDMTACNYDLAATCDDGSCILPDGCSDSTALNYDVLATCDDGSCMYFVYGCTDSIASNYDSLATIDDGSCLACIYGCMDNTMFNYNPLATCDSTNGTSCILYVYGCTDPLAYNYYPGANTDDGSCCLVMGCTDFTASNYNVLACLDDSSCTYITSCTSPAPTGLATVWTTDTKAQVEWDNMNSSTCMTWKYAIRYREVGTSAWSTKSAGVGNGLCLFGLNTTVKTLQNLTSATTYEYKMKAWYCGGTESNYSSPSQFTTGADCPGMTNLTVATFNGNQQKATFSWNSDSSVVFARIALRVDTSGAAWQTAGGFGVYWPTLSINKFGLTPGQSYRAQGKTFCDANITSYKSGLTPPIFWTQPGTIIRIDGGTTINNLDIYPNPSRDIFNVTFTSEDTQDLNVRVINVVGEVVYTENLEQFVGEYTKAIDLATYTKGIYFLEITTNNGVVNKKLILQ